MWILEAIWQLSGFDSESVSRKVISVFFAIIAIGSSALWYMIYARYGILGVVELSVSVLFLISSLLAYKFGFFSTKGRDSRIEDLKDILLVAVLATLLPILCPIVLFLVLAFV